MFCLIFSWLLPYVVQKQYTCCTYLLIALNLAVYDIYLLATYIYHRKNQSDIIYTSNITCHIAIYAAIPAVLVVTDENKRGYILKYHSIYMHANIACFLLPSACLHVVCLLSLLAACLLLVCLSSWKIPGEWARPDGRSGSCDDAWLRCRDCNSYIQERAGPYELKQVGGASTTDR